MTINQNKKRAFSYKTVQHSVYKKAVGVRLGYLPPEQKKKPLKIKGFSSGRNRTRTCDPIDVNDVLYQLSHATLESIGDLAVGILGAVLLPANRLAHFVGENLPVCSSN